MCLLRVVKSSGTVSQSASRAGRKSSGGNEVALLCQTEIRPPHHLHAQSFLSYLASVISRPRRKTKATAPRRFPSGGGGGGGGDGGVRGTKGHSNTSAFTSDWGDCSCHTVGPQVSLIVAPLTAQPVQFGGCHVYNCLSHLKRGLDLIPRTRSFQNFQICVHCCFLSVSLIRLAAARRVEWRSPAPCWPRPSLQRQAVSTALWV